MKLAFAGTPAVAVPSLRALLASDHDVVAVITRPPALAGRGRQPAPAPVADLAASEGLAVLRPQRPGEPEFLAQLRQFDVDACAVVAYGALLPPAALDVPRHGWINLHFSLLPAWRGAAPVQHAILAGDEITGASTFRIEAGLDTGPVYGTVTEPIRPTDTSGELLERLSESGSRLLVATMDGIANGTLVPVPQPGDGVSIAGKLTPADAQVRWDAPARRVDRLIRACTPEPGAWTTFRSQRLRLGPVRWRDARRSTTAALGPGRLRVERNRVVVGTATDEVELGTVQPPGKRPMPAADWARGARPGPEESFGA